MKTKINLENLENVAGGFEIANEEELKRLYEEKSVKIRASVLLGLKLVKLLIQHYFAIFCFCF